MSEEPLDLGFSVSVFRMSMLLFKTSGTDLRRPDCVHTKLKLLAAPGH